MHIQRLGEHPQWYPCLARHYHSRDDWIRSSAHRNNAFLVDPHQQDCAWYVPTNAYNNTEVAFMLINPTFYASLRCQIRHYAYCWSWSCYLGD